VIYATTGFPGRSYHDGRRKQQRSEISRLSAYVPHPEDQYTALLVSGTVVLEGSMVEKIAVTGLHLDRLPPPYIRLAVGLRAYGPIRREPMDLPASRPSLSPAALAEGPQPPWGPDSAFASSLVSNRGFHEVIALRFARGGESHDITSSWVADDSEAHALFAWAPLRFFWKSRSQRVAVCLRLHSPFGGQSA
jgi:hypothetical protein